MLKLGKNTLNFGIFQKIESIAPLKLAESWDNVGFLIEPENEVKVEKILLTNDLTRNVMNEALERDVQMIIAYHPLIFGPIKQIRQNYWKNAIITKCVKRDIYVYCPHTALDAVAGGINDWIVEIFDTKSKEPIVSIADTSSGGDHTSIQGSGRFCVLKESISLSRTIDLLRQHLSIPNFLVAQSAKNKDMNESMIQSIAVCAGSGASVLKLCEKHADLWITGEMSHHDILDATESLDRPTSVILTAGHSNSERGYLKKRLGPYLKSQLETEGVDVIVSEQDSDPLVVV